MQTWLYANICSCKRMELVSRADFLGVFYFFLVPTVGKNKKRGFKYIKKIAQS
ncbi:hypothetical protein OIU74_006013, partial [Salix koriyanagi]